jgi:hypothetical protein
MASLSSLLANIAISTNAKKGTTPKLTTPLEFMPDWADEIDKSQSTKPQGVEEMKQMMMSFVSASKKRKRRELQPPLQHLKRKQNGGLRNNDSNLGGNDQGGSANSKNDAEHVKQHKRQAE